MAEINLDGGEISIIKALGTGGSVVSGEALMLRVPDMEFAEFTDSMKCLVIMGYVIADRSSFHSKDEFNQTNFHVNSGYARELKESLDPRPDDKKSRRVRRE